MFTPVESYFLGVSPGSLSIYTHTHHVLFFYCIRCVARRTHNQMYSTLLSRASEVSSKSSLDAAKVTFIQEMRHCVATYKEICEEAKRVYQTRARNLRVC